MNSAVDELAAVKAKRNSLLERVANRRKQRRDRLVGVVEVPGLTAVSHNESSSVVPHSNLGTKIPVEIAQKKLKFESSDQKLQYESHYESKPVVLSEGQPIKSVINNLLVDNAIEPDYPPTKTKSLVVGPDPPDSLGKPPPPPPPPIKSHESDLELLLGAETAREKEDKRIQQEIDVLLHAPTAKERILNERFRTQGGSQVQQFCPQGTRAECSKQRARQGIGHDLRCTKLHFRKIIHSHTDESLGDCSFLNTCFHVDTCKYVHYTIDYSDQQQTTIPTDDQTESSMRPVSKLDSTEPTMLYPPQWINCDIRLLNMSILGKFSVIMADPPWDIHMELPYGTMSDDEMRKMDIPCLQDDGYIFLWVTGRAMELGRECLKLWGYQRVDEIIWVKTNQLQRLIRTGRTGHWLNHGKEHCLVGVKGKPQSVNRGLDCDVIVSEVRETSHKPDEIYGIIERLSPGTRKLELFGRPHNLQPNWMTLGNQLDGTYLVDPAVVERFRKQYPNGLDEQSKGCK